MQNLVIVKNKNMFDCFFLNSKNEKSNQFLDSFVTFDLGSQAEIFLLIYLF
jgi:hypothetical protein